MDQVDESHLLQEGWIPVDAVTAAKLASELVREVSPGHVLYGRRAVAVARRSGRDDVLFKVEAGTTPFYVVHLSWQKESDPSWPSFACFEDYAQFLRDANKDDEDA